MYDLILLNKTLNISLEVEKYDLMRSHIQFQKTHNMILFNREKNIDSQSERNGFFPIPIFSIAHSATLKSKAFR